MTGMLHGQTFLFGHALGLGACVLAATATAIGPRRDSTSRGHTIASGLNGRFQLAGRGVLFVILYYGFTVSERDVHVSHTIHRLERARYRAGATGAAHPRNFQMFRLHRDTSFQR